LKAALHKSTIPPSHIFVIRHLNEKHFDPVWHAHYEYQLFVVLEGTGTRFIGDSIKAFRPGELIFTGPHLPHLWRSDEAYFEKKSNLSTSGIVIYFNENFLGDHIMEKEEMVMLKKLFTKSMRGLEFYGQKKLQVVKMMQELTKMQGIESVIQLLRILEILSSTKEYHYISSRAYNDVFNQNETDRLNQVYEYVIKNFRRKILLEELADLLCMTPTSFSRFFTMKNNKPFSKFVAEIRIKHACKLLTETEDSISQICYECGFNTLSNFNKQFKDIMLKKPTQYKEEFMSI
jgi:AraC-like DNA-binding protein